MSKSDSMEEGPATAESSVLIARAQVAIEDLYPYARLTKTQKCIALISMLGMEIASCDHVESSMNCAIIGLKKSTKSAADLGVKRKAALNARTDLLRVLSTWKKQ